AALQRALDDGAPVDGRGDFGETALIDAAGRGLPKVVRWLLEHGASTELEDRGGRTALVSACDSSDLNDPQARSLARGKREAASLLLDHGARIHVEGGSSSALDAAVKGGDPGLVELLLSRGAGGKEALLRGLGGALAAGRKKVVSLLLSRGALDGQLPENGPYLLHQAAWGGVFGAIKELVKRGVDVNAAWEGDPPLVAAAEHNQILAMGLLLDSGARIDARGVGGETALMQAAAACNVPAVRLLLMMGAKSGLKDDEGKTALGRSGCDDVAARLKAPAPSR
ncbi:MAG: ankyrin repeat domain-containing protein, partial [Elusimicrobia bacterium]|nr:ankyrin repeat domain-containing protein [Elusimicrobiota bacterium]